MATPWDEVVEKILVKWSQKEIASKELLPLFTDAEIIQGICRSNPQLREDSYRAWEKEVNKQLQTSTKFRQKAEKFALRTRPQSSPQNPPAQKDPSSLKIVWRFQKLEMCSGLEFGKNHLLDGEENKSMGSQVSLSQPLRVLPLEVEDKGKEEEKGEVQGKEAESKGKEVEEEWKSDSPQGVQCTSPPKLSTDTRGNQTPTQIKANKELTKALQNLIQAHRSGPKAMSSMVDTINSFCAQENLGRLRMEGFEKVYGIVVNVKLLDMHSTCIWKLVKVGCTQKKEDPYYSRPEVVLSQLPTKSHIIFKLPMDPAYRQGLLSQEEYARKKLGYLVPKKLIKKFKLPYSKEWILIEQDRLDNFIKLQNEKKIAKDFHAYDVSLVRSLPSLPMRPEICPQIMKANESKLLNLELPRKKKTPKAKKTREKPDCNSTELKTKPPGYTRGCHVKYAARRTSKFLSLKPDKHSNLWNSDALS